VSVQNLRKVLPRFIKRLIANNQITLTVKYLLEYEFIKKKTIITGVDGLVDDYKLILKQELREEEHKKALESILSALEQISHLLKDDASQVGPQLVGYISEDNNKYLEQVVQNINKKTKGVWLRSLHSELSSSQGHLTRLYNGQKDAYTIEFSIHKDVFYTSSSEYNINSSVIVWNLNSNDFIKILKDNHYDDHIYRIKEINGKYLFLITSIEANTDGYCIKVWNIEKEKLIKRKVFKVPPDRIDLNMFWLDIEVVSDYVLTIDPGDQTKLVFWHVPSLNSMFHIFHEERILAFTSCEYLSEGNNVIRIATAHTFTFTNIIEIHEKTDEVLSIKMREFFYDGDVADLIFGENQNILIASGKNGIIKIYDLSKEESKYLNKEKAVNDEVLSKIQLSPNKEYLLSLHSRSCHIWYLPAFHKAHVYRQETKNKIITDLVDDKFLVLDEGLLKVWNLYSGDLIYKSPGWLNVIFLKFIDEKRLLCGKNDELSYWKIKHSIDYQVEIWGTGNETERKNAIHKGAINKVLIFDKNKILTSSEDGSLKICLIENLNCLQTFSGFAESIDDMEVYIKGNEYFALSTSQNKINKENYEIRIWNLTKKKHHISLHGHTSNITKVKSFRSGRYVISISRDNTAKFWDIGKRKGECIQTFKITDLRILNETEDFAFYNDGISLVTGGEKGILRFWNIDYGAMYRQIQKHNDLIVTIEINEIGTLMLTGSRDKTIMLWDLKNYSHIKTFKGHERTIEKVAFLNYNLHYNKKKERFLYSLNDMTNHETCYFISVSNDGTIKIWDNNSEECIMNLVGHKDNSVFRKSINIILFKKSPKVLSYGMDGKVILWDLLVGEKITSLTIVE